MLNEVEMSEWVCKLYSKMVHVSGIKGKQMKVVDESQILNGNTDWTAQFG